MAATEFKLLDNLPIREDLLNVKTEPEEALKTKAAINLSINATNTIFRFNTILKYIKEDLKHPVLSNFLTLKAINLTLESYLVTLLNIPVITNFDKSKLTEHYKRRKIVVQGEKEIPSEFYCEQLMFTNNKTWGGMYGTLSYFLNLREEYEEYQTPSQLVELNTQKLIEIMINKQTVKLIYSSQDKLAKQMYELLKRLEADLESESEQGDVSIYSKIVEIIIQIENIDEAYKQLKFYEIYLPAIVSWYLCRYREGEEISKPTKPEEESEERAYELVTEIVEKCLSYGLDEMSFKNISTGLVYQSIAPVFYGLCEELAYIRRSTSYEYVRDTNRSKTEIEKFADLMMLNINPFKSLTIVREASNTILESYAPPGGYALFAVMIAANLINRAYILTHSSRESNTDAPLEGDEQIISRISRLIYLAGVALKKTQIEHIQIIGENLKSISGIGNIIKDEKDLIDGRYNRL